MNCLHPKLTLALFLTLATAAEAQRTCRILFLGAPTNAPKELLLFDGKGLQKVELPDMNLSPIYEISKEALSLRLLEKVPASLEEIPVAAPSAKLGKDFTHFYLLVRHDPKNTFLPVAMQIINANAGTFGPGEMLWLNLTENRIGGLLGSQKLNLNPRSRSITKAPVDGAGSYDVALYYQKAGEKQVWPICETSWSHNPSGRILVFVIPESGSKIPRIMGFPDYRVETKPQQKNTP